MPKNEKDYSDYIQHLSTVSNSISLLTGFTFTSITVLLTLLPDPSLLFSQITLFLLMFLLYLLHFLSNWVTTESIRHCRRVPKLKRSTSVFNLLMFMAAPLFGVAILLMFLIFNLIYLTLISLVVQISFLILVYITIWKPFLEYRKKPSESK